MTRISLIILLAFGLTVPAFADVTLKMTTGGKGLGMSAKTNGTTSDVWDMAAFSAEIGKSVSMTTAVDGVETGALADDLFAPPAGYKLNAKK